MADNKIKKCPHYDQATCQTRFPLERCGTCDMYRYNEDEGFAYCEAIHTGGSMENTERKWW